MPKISYFCITPYLNQRKAFKQHWNDYKYERELKAMTDKPRSLEHYGDLLSHDPDWNLSATDNVKMVDIRKTYSGLWEIIPVDTDHLKKEAKVIMGPWNRYRYETRESVIRETTKSILKCRSKVIPEIRNRSNNSIHIIRSETSCCKEKLTYLLI